MYRYSIVSCFILIASCLLLSNSFASLPANDSQDNLVLTDFSWPYESSDLSPDPSILRGKLSNGLRYIIKENQEPDNRVAAYLVVLAGSSEEREEQQGVAHFLEHLMFNGSANFPPDTLVDYFQSIGMDFGGDTNAYTGFDRTVYHLILPSGSDGDLDIGCTVLADFARRALLQDSEIEKERGVIFSEKRSRDSARYRNNLAYSKFAFKGTRYPNRFPIGTEEVLQSADQALLKDFYDSWYRPENIVVVLVGDLNTMTAEKIVSNQFSGLTGVGEMPERPAFGELHHNDLEVFYNFEPDLGSTNVSIETLWNVTPQSPDIAGERNKIIRIIADIIIGYRLQRQQEGAKQPYVSARYSSGFVARRIGYGSLYGVTDKSRWKETLESFYLTLESARRYGFTPQELESSKLEVYSELSKNVQTVSSLNSRVIAERIVHHLVDRDVYMSPQQEQQLYTPILDQITVDDVNNGFNAIWNRSGRLITVSGDVHLPEPANVKIKDYYGNLAQKKVSKNEAVQKIIFPYIQSPDARGSVREIVDYPSIKMTRFILNNGLVINYKKTDYEPNKVRISAHFGSGEQNEYLPGSGFVADDIVNLSGTSTLSLSDLESVIAGSSVDLSFRIGRASSSWSGSSLTSDYPLMVKVLNALLLDPGFKLNAYTKVMQRMELMQSRLSKEIDGAVLYGVQPFFAGGSNHYGLPRWEKLSKLKFDDLRSWVKSLFDLQDLEISIVGDIESDHVIPLLTQYFGAFSLGKKPYRLGKELIAFPDGETLTMSVDSSIEKAKIFLTWPTDDFWNINQTRRLSILSAILEDRVRKIVREKLGASYSPSVSSYGSRVNIGYGTMQIEVDVEHGMEMMILHELKKMVVELVNGGVSSEELERAKKPILTTVYDNIYTNQYWLYSVLALSSSFPQQLKWPTTIVDDIKSISPVEIDALSRKYLDNSTAAIAIIRSSTNVQKVSKVDKPIHPESKSSAN